MCAVHSFHFTEEVRRNKFMGCICCRPCIHSVSRSTLFEDIVQLYAEENICLEHPMNMKFVGEQAVDCGGVSRDMVSGFWEVAYIKSFDGSRL